MHTDRRVCSSSDVLPSYVQHPDFVPILKFNHANKNFKLMLNGEALTQFLSDGVLLGMAEIERITVTKIIAERKSSLWQKNLDEAVRRVFALIARLTLLNINKTFAW